MVGHGGEFGTRRFAVRRAGLALMGALSMSALGSCAGSSTQSGGDGTSGPVSEGEFVRKVVEAVCGSVGSCCAAAGIPYDRAGCVANGLEELVLEPPPNATWDSVAAGKCFDWYVRVVSACYEIETDDEPCRDIYRGTLPEGAACEDSRSCADMGGSNATCTYDDITLSGSCAREVEAPRGRGGDACIGTCDGNSCGVGISGENNAICYVQDGLVCSSASGVCASAPALNEPCFDFYCAAGAYCSLLDMTCLPIKPNGQACEYDQECAGGSCANSICGPSTIASVELCTGL